MFAVPGWSISTSDLKLQPEASASKQQAPVSDAADASNQSGRTEKPDNSKKRKREQGKKNGVVTKSNLDEMFRRHIEGHTGNDGSKKNKKKNNKDKNTKRESNQGDNDLKNDVKNILETSSNGPVTAEEEGRPGKKQKKSKDNKKTHGKKDISESVPAADASETLPPPPPAPPAPAAGAKLTPLQQKMRDKLMSARFRHLNETLYTTPSKQAFEMFTANPELFAEYHAGFSRQVKESWPSNPVDGYITTIQKRGAVSPNFNKRGPKSASGPNQLVALPRRPNGMCTIADMGCGDAQLARALTPSAKKLQLKLLSYDLHAPDPLITKADVANLPLADGTVDITVFCLSLMGTNWVSFVEEAYRVLRGDGKGECWVSEVKSRFGRVNRKKAQIGLKKQDMMSNTQKKKGNKKKKGGKGGDDDDEGFDDEDDIYAEDANQNQANASDETDTSAFVEIFKSRGFVLKQESVEKSNKMFIKMEFVKAGGAPTKGKYAGVVPSGKPAPAQTKKKFIDNDVDTKGMTAEEEAKVLKPCVYKIR